MEKFIRFIFSCFLQTIIGFITLNLFFIIATLKSSYVRYPNNPKINASIQWMGKDDA